MSHELRTPLNAIGGDVALLELGVRGPVTDEQRIDLERIQRSQRHLLGLIDEVFNYARIETGKVHSPCLAEPAGQPPRIVGERRIRPQSDELLTMEQVRHGETGLAYRNTVCGERA
jgi:signal transduction histidine kinase